MTNAQALPVVTPYLLRRADDMCPRRLALTYDDSDGTQGAFTRYRIRYPLLDAARNAHAELRPPDPQFFTPPADLLPDEQKLFRRVSETYCRVFAGEPVRTILGHPGERRTESKRLGVMVGGAVDLLVEDPDGGRELRQFELWGRDVCADPAESWETLLAVLRLVGFLGDVVLRVRHVDLVHGKTDERLVDLARNRAGIVRRFEERLELVRSRADKDSPEEGQDCGTCPYIPLCGVHW